MKLAICARVCRSLGAAGLAMLLAAHGFSTAAQAQDSTAHVLWQPSMNVFRRHAVEAAVMHDFYRDVVGLQQLATIGVGGGGGVARFQAGGSELKFTRRVADRSYRPGGVRNATGLRLLSLFFPDAGALADRFAAHGLPRPEFKPVGSAGERRALVTDPDGQWLELVVVPDAPASLYAQIEVGLTVADVEISRAFYRDFVGLEELPPEHDTQFDTAKYSFRHGSTLVSLRSFGADLPADTGSGGIQYVVSNVDFVDALAHRRAVTIDQPLNDFGGMGLRTVWLDDPDGITNYFAETRASRESAAP
jgi:catechol-2,3-dioxygenase